ncbi:C1 family peptidase [Companilactobacillus sp. DQM5]|uniref:C1 family peptidase n=1 Tax=Companilactobacillus sp. DQM5 TaxID=3463359 RepID=UPI00405976BB
MEITNEILKKFDSDLKNIPASNVIKNTVATNGIYKSSENLSSKINMDPVFSIDLNTSSVTDQMKSGLCWVFAALNTLRHPIEQEFKIKDFELSQGYILFWDKLEKSNFFYSNVINTANLPVGNRKVDFLMTTPQQDGGQWDMVCALIEKYGLVPKSVMPDTFSRKNSTELNDVLNKKLRKDAIVLRELVKQNASSEKIEETKEKMLSEIYRILIYSVGTPPTVFNWSYRDKDKNYHEDKGITPQQFFKKYINWNLSDYVSIINSPTDDKPFNHVYTVEMLGNVVRGRPVRHLNLDIKEFKSLAIKQLKSGESVWFGSDVGQSSDSKLGIMDPDLHNIDHLFESDFSMTKAQRLDYAESLMTHAMVITGVNLDEDTPTKWKVENSWGQDVGTKGYFTMSDKWFDEYTYQIVINKKYLPENLQLILKNETNNPKILSPWDPMGALA